MKRLLLILFGAFLLFSCAEQMREQDIPLPNLSFSDQWDAGYDNVTISCTVTGNMTAERLSLEYGTDESLSQPKSETFNNQGKDFSLSISGLKAQTTYYYRYTVDNKISTYTDSEIRQFTTRSYSSPIITTLEAEAIFGTRATLKSQLEDTGGKPITERGFLFGEDQSKMEKRPSTSKDGTLELESLSFGTKYYYQAYAVSEIGTGTGDIKEFTTCSAVTFKPVEVNDISATGAVVTGGIESDGGVTIETQGFRLKMDGASTYSFILSEGEATLSGLKPDTKYKVWYYAKTFEGEFESDAVEFQTTSGVITLVTKEAENVTSTSALLKGTVSSDGGNTITERGFLYGKEEDVESKGTKQIVEGTTGDFQYSLTQLTAKTKYYFKAFAKNSVGTYYGELKSFETSSIAVTSVTLDKSTLSLNKGETATLVATVKPDNATDKTVTWTSSNTSVATVSEGKVTAVAGGTATITAKAGDKSATCAVTVTQASSGPEAVDLGLPSGIKWASYNVGATKPEEYGDYFAWGETEPKSDYSWSTYKWCKGSNNILTKYNTNSDYGVVDNKTQLEMSDDAARANWGGKWRMPTDAERKELYDNCTWTWTTRNGVNGYQVTSSKNGNSIFLPAAGCRDGSSTFVVGSSGYYWSSSLNTDYPRYAWRMYFDLGDHDVDVSNRCDGRSVRPVYGNLVSVTNVSLSQTSLTLEVGQTATLTATVKPDNATDKTVSWSSSNTSVATVSNGTVTARSEGTATITAIAGNKYATCTVTVTQSNYGGHEAVDLGLSVKWASCNVGASKPEEYGDYFAWGETTTKSNYGESTYKWCNGSNHSLTKYNTNLGWGTVDNWTQLEVSDDAARANWGGSWRMPTKAEFDELTSNCTYTWTTQNGVKGYRVTSKKNGNSIFLPAAGDRLDSSTYNVGSFGGYWSSSLWMDYPSGAWELSFNSTHFGTYCNDRMCGFSVRPVHGDLISVTSVSLNQTSLALEVGKTATLTATVKPYNATDKTVSWTSSDTSVATVSNGTVTAKAEGTATITAIAGNKYATCTVTVTYSVDLGLSVKWASCNVGASKPEDFGDYFAWGETTTKNNYTWTNYKFRKSGDSNNNVTFTKYNTKNSRGTVDNKTVLDLSDDAARANWGGSWRMPTKAEFEELISNCTWIWTTRNGVNGYQVTSSKNGNSIFLPAAGCRDGSSAYDVGSLGRYWSSSLNTDYPDYAWLLLFNSSSVDANVFSSRCSGRSVRPVTE